MLWNVSLRWHRINLLRICVSQLFFFFKVVQATPLQVRKKQSFVELIRAIRIRIGHTGRKRELFKTISRLYRKVDIFAFFPSFFNCISVSFVSSFIGNVHLGYNTLLLLLLSDNNWHLFFLFLFGCDGISFLFSFVFCLFFFFFLSVFCSFLLLYYCF